MARFKRSALINANRYVAASSYVLKVTAKKAKKEIKRRRAAVKAGQPI